MQDLEKIAIQKLSINLLSYFSYVDIILPTPLDSTNIILEIFNSHIRLQFTMEIDWGKIKFFARYDYDW